MANNVSAEVLRLTVPPSDPRLSPSFLHRTPTTFPLPLLSRSPKQARKTGSWGAPLPFPSSPARSVCVQNLPLGLWPAARCSRRGGAHKTCMETYRAVGEGGYIRPLPNCWTRAGGEATQTGPQLITMRAQDPKLRIRRAMRTLVLPGGPPTLRVAPRAAGQVFRHASAVGGRAAAGWRSGGGRWWSRWVRDAGTCGCPLSVMGLDDGAVALGGSTTATMGAMRRLFLFRLVVRLTGAPCEGGSWW